MSGLNIELSIKEFNEPYALPCNYANGLSDVFVIDQADDLEAANEFVRRYGDRLITDKGRTFWRDDNFLYTDDCERVRKGIFAAVARMRIFYRGFKGLMPYSSTSRHVEACMKQVIGFGRSTHLLITDLG